MQMFLWIHTILLDIVPNIYNVNETSGCIKAAVSLIFTELWLKILFHQKF